MPKTLYEVLEIAPSASPSVIKAAYKALILRHHPDRNPGSAEAARLTQEINDAYRVLSDPELPAAYDNLVRQAGFGRQSTEPRREPSFGADYAKGRASCGGSPRPWPFGRRPWAVATGIGLGLTTAFVLFNSAGKEALLLGFMVFAGLVVVGAGVIVVSAVAGWVKTIRATPTAPVLVASVGQLLGLTFMAPGMVLTYLGTQAQGAHYDSGWSFVLTCLFSPFLWGHIVAQGGFVLAAGLGVGLVTLALGTGKRYFKFVWVVVSGIVFAALLLGQQSLAHVK